MFFGTRTMPSTDSYWDKLDRLSEAFAAADAVLIGGGYWPISKRLHIVLLPLGSYSP